LVNKGKKEENRKEGVEGRCQSERENWVLTEREGKGMKVVSKAAWFEFFYVIIQVN